MLAANTFASPIKRQFQDMKYPTQQAVEKQSFDNLLAGSTTYVLLSNAGPASAATTVVSTFNAQPDVARNILITPGATTGDVEACVVTVSGLNYGSSTISENFTFLANASTAQTGSKAFKTVSSVSFPANCESGGFAATWNIGLGEKIGLKRCLGNAGDILFSLLNGAKEATAPTMTASASAMESNTADFNGTMNGANDFVLYFFQNYGCF